jgi:adenosine kinase
MLQHAREFRELKIPFIFDPGQGLPMFDGPELLEFVRLADYCTVNDYEAKLLTERTGKSLEELAREVKALIVTLGGSGSRIYANGAMIDIPVVPAEELRDPTGCGDAYRAGLLYGIARDWPWEKTGRLAALMGSIKIAHRGGQNHKPTRADIAARFHAVWGESLD